MKKFLDGLRRVSRREFLLLGLVPAFLALLAVVCYKYGGPHLKALTNVVVIVAVPIFTASLMFACYEATRLFRCGCRCKAVLGLGMYVLSILVSLLGLMAAMVGSPI